MGYPSGPKCRQAAIIGPVQELLARPFFLALQRGEKIVTVDVHLVAPADRADATVEQTLLDVVRARCGQQRRQHVFV